MDNLCPFCNKEVRSVERHIMANHLNVKSRCFCNQFVGTAPQLMKKHWARHGGVIAHWLALQLEGKGHE